MAGQARRRTVAQRRAKDEDEDPLSYNEILDNDGHEEQIRLLRQKEIHDNRQAHMVLDIGVVIAFIISILQFFDHISSPNPIFCILSIIQAISVPFSLTPHWLPFLKSPIPSDIHLYLFSIHLTISLCAVFLRYQHSLSSPIGVAMDLELGEIARWIMPALVVGAIDIQRRGEKQSEEKLGLLESMKYDLKGA